MRQLHGRSHGQRPLPAAATGTRAEQHEQRSRALASCLRCVCIPAHVVMQHWRNAIVAAGSDRKVECALQLLLQDCTAAISQRWGHKPG
ncbi:hypothetical protein EMGBS3_16090 [Anaerolineaceae bacterium]|nr:hypothetical protein EMGBS3_16090 [Anaerolineaceae bacterium]